MPKLPNRFACRVRLPAKESDPFGRHWRRIWVILLTTIFRDLQWSDCGWVNTISGCKKTPKPLSCRHSQNQSVTLAIILIAFIAGCDQTSNQLAYRNHSQTTATKHRSRSSIQDVIREGGVDRKRDIISLIDSGADLNQLDVYGSVPVILATSWGGQFDIACLLLESGADFMAYSPGTNMRLAHFVESERMKGHAMWPPRQAADHAKLVRLLEERGESFEEIRNDFARWDKEDSGKSPALINSMRDRETALLKTLEGGRGESEPELEMYRLIRIEGSHRFFRIRDLLREGVGLNRPLLNGETPAMLAVRQRSQFGLALTLLKAGADPSVQFVDLRTGRPTRLRLVHYVARAADAESKFSDQQRREYSELVQWLSEHGDSVEQAKGERHFWDDLPRG